MQRSTTTPVGQRSRRAKPATGGLLNRASSRSFTCCRRRSFVAVFLLYPVVITVWQGFTDYDGITDPVFIGFDNYRRLFADSALPALAAQHADLDRRGGGLAGRRSASSSRSP